MVVVTREGKAYVVVGDRLLSEDGFLGLADRVDCEDVITHGYRHDDLIYDSTYVCDRKWDIVEVYSKIDCFSQFHYYKTELVLLWKRSSVVEISHRELEKLFGCSVKIIDSKECVYDSQIDSQIDSCT